MTTGLRDQGGTCVHRFRTRRFAAFRNDKLTVVGDFYPTRGGCGWSLSRPQPGSVPRPGSGGLPRDRRGAELARIEITYVL